MSLRKASIKNAKIAPTTQLPPELGVSKYALCSAQIMPIMDALEPKPTSPIPESTLRWYGVDLAESQALAEG